MMLGRFHYRTALVWVLNVLARGVALRPRGRTCVAKGREQCGAIVRLSRRDLMVV